MGARCARSGVAAEATCGMAPIVPLPSPLLAEGSAGRLSMKLQGPPDVIAELRASALTSLTFTLLNVDRPATYG
jgi:hypothetical protein